MSDQNGIVGFKCVYLLSFRYIVLLNIVSVKSTIFGRWATMQLTHAVNNPAIRFQWPCEALDSFQSNLNDAPAIQTVNGN